jgi:hypothetical protein
VYQMGLKTGCADEFSIYKLLFAQYKFKSFYAQRSLIVSKHYNPCLQLGCPASRVPRKLASNFKPPTILQTITANHNQQVHDDRATSDTRTILSNQRPKATTQHLTPVSRWLRLRRNASPGYQCPPPAMTSSRNLQHSLPPHLMTEIPVSPQSG